MREHHVRIVRINAQAAAAGQKFVRTEPACDVEVIAGTGHGVYLKRLLQSAGEKSGHCPDLFCSAPWAKEKAVCTTGQHLAVEQSVFSRVRSRLGKQPLCVWLQINISCIFLQDLFHPRNDLTMDVAASSRPCGDPLAFRAGNIDRFSLFINGNDSPGPARQNKDLIRCGTIRQRAYFPFF